MPLVRKYAIGFAGCLPLVFPLEVRSFINPVRLTTSHMEIHTYETHYAPTDPQ